MKKIILAVIVGGVLGFVIGVLISPKLDIDQISGGVIFSIVISIPFFWVEKCLSRVRKWWHNRVEFKKSKKKILSDLCDEINGWLIDNFAGVINWKQSRMDTTVMDNIIRSVNRKLCFLNKELGVVLKDEKNILNVTNNLSKFKEFIKKRRDWLSGLQYKEASDKDNAQLREKIAKRFEKTKKSIISLIVKSCKRIG